MKKRIHIFGASGSGTTTIAEKTAMALGYAHFDADDYFWEPSAEPFTVERPRAVCLRLLKQELAAHDKWVLSGSLSGWGEMFMPYFDLSVFVYVPQEVRLERLKKRERLRYGDQILPGGARHKHSVDFLAWAAGYDEGTMSGRSLVRHRAWIEGAACPVVNVINLELGDSVTAALNAARMEINDVFGGCR